MMIGKLNKWVKILRLENWDIDVIDYPTLEVMGRCKMLYNDFKAVIQIKSELSEEEKEKALVHELLHLLHRDSFDIASDNLTDEITTLYERCHERAIERMAQILYNNIQTNGYEIQYPNKEKR